MSNIILTLKADGLTHLPVSIRRIPKLHSINSIMDIDPWRVVPDREFPRFTFMENNYILYDEVIDLELITTSINPDAKQIDVNHNGNNILIISISNLLLWDEVVDYIVVMLKNINRLF